MWINRFSFNTGSLTRRLSVVFFLANSFTLLCAFIGFMVVGAYFSKDSFEQELLAISRVVASTSRAALAFQDAEGCKRVIGALEARTDITYAALRDAQGQVFCDKGVAGIEHSTTAPVGERISWAKSLATVVQPVILDREVLGELIIEATSIKLIQQFFWLLPIGLGVTLLVSLGAALFSHKLKSWLSGPIFSLQQLARQVSETQDLSGRLELTRGDEINELIQSFNQMLAQLEERGRSLSEAKERAESADRAKSLYVASMSHELRTPLHAILTITDEFIDMELNPEQRELLNILRSSGKSLLSIINDILDFSKIEAGKLALNFAPFSLRGFMDRTLKMFALPFKNKGVRISYSIAPEIIDRIVGDEGRLSQILVNLVGNALKFTEPGGSVECVVTPGDGSTAEKCSLHFAVRDTGVGIPPDRIEEIFEPFTQLSQKRKVTQGTGLGLAIAQRLVRAMHGRLWAESCTGEGSTFHFIIQCGIAPAVEHQSGPADDAQRLTQIDVSQSFDGAPSKRYRALIVEDHPVNLKIAQRILEKRGYDTATATNGQECLDLLATSEVVDIVLMDINMPIMDGLEASRRIRALPDPLRSSLPIVALTAHVTPEEAQQCYDAGMNAFLTKPLNRDKLFAILNELLTAREESLSEHSERIPSAGLSH